MREYPIYLSDRGQKALDVLFDGLEAGELYNVDYKEACYVLGGEFERTTNVPIKDLETRSPVWFVARHVSESLGMVTSINRLIRDHEKWLKNPTVSRYDLDVVQEVPDAALIVVQDVLEVLKSWKVYVDLRKTLKPMIVKGRKPTPKKALDPNAPMQTKGTCPACFRPMVVKDDRVVRHGWKESGWRRVGEYGNVYHSTPCFCTNYKPFEVSPEGTRAYLDRVLKPFEASETKYLVDLEARPEMLQAVLKADPVTCIPFKPPEGQNRRTWPGKLVKVYRDAEDKDESRLYETWLKSRVNAVEAQLKAVRAEIAQKEKAVAEWKPGKLWEEQAS